MKLGKLATGAISLALAATVLGPTARSGAPKPQFLPGYTEQRMNELYQLMTSNVTQIYTPQSEIERWQDNVAMWHLLLAHLNDPQQTNLALLKETFRLMQGNVRHIMQNAERERWEANLQLWQLTIARLEDPTVLTLSQFNAALGVMDANVCCITEVREHERWQANHDMWQLMVARIGNQGILRAARWKADLLGRVSGTT